MNKKMYKFYMGSGKKILEYIDAFNKLIGDLGVNLKTKMVLGPKFKYDMDCIKILSMSVI